MPLNPQELLYLFLLYLTPIRRIYPDQALLTQSLKTLILPKSKRNGVCFSQGGTGSGTERSLVARTWTFLLWTTNRSSRMRTRARILPRPRPDWKKQLRRRRKRRLGSLWTGTLATRKWLRSVAQLEDRWNRTRVQSASRNQIGKLKLIIMNRTQRYSICFELLAAVKRVFWPARKKILEFLMQYIQV